MRAKKFAAKSIKSKTDEIDHGGQLLFDLTKEIGNQEYQGQDIRYESFNTNIR